MIYTECKMHLGTEAVEGAALTLEGVDNVHGSDGLALGVISVGDRVTDNALEEDVQDSASLLIDGVADALDTTTASQAADRGLGDALQVVAGNLAMTLSATLAGTLSTLTTSSHC